MADTGENLKAKAGSREILPGVFVYPTPAEVARAAARLFVDYAWQAISRYGQFFVALSGGHTPRAMFELLASGEFRGQVDWAKVHVFWSDERAVPPDHPDSNYGMARRELLLRVPIPYPPRGLAGSEPAPASVCTSKTRSPSPYSYQTPRRAEWFAKWFTLHRRRFV